MFFDGAPNKHLSADTAKLLKLQQMDLNVFARPSISDKARLQEFQNQIYVAENYLTEQLYKSRPQVLIDLGANIGTSSASIARHFESITKVIGIEADLENFRVLQANYSLWESECKTRQYIPINAIASAHCDDQIVQEASLFELGNINASASGTFRFSLSNEKSIPITGQSSVLGLSTLVSNLDPTIGIICKIDIEGGEQRLFETHTDWVSHVSYMTIEIHDRFDQALSRSSKNLLKILYDLDFAVVPEKDILHCYSRPLLNV